MSGAGPLPMRDLVDAMRACEQVHGLSVLAHGEMVADRYLDLVGHLRHGQALSMEWRLPDWVRDPRVLAGLPPDEVMSTYHLFHDCGKPRCLVVDGEGRRRFPGHAEASRSAWLAVGGDPAVADLIGMDMDVHLLKDEGVPEFSSRPQAMGLLLTGLSEVHANAGLFGGIGTDSFKMKWKVLDKRGKAVLRRLATSG